MTNEPQKTPSPDTQPQKPAQTPQQTQGDPKSGNDKSGNQQK
jgi:hypothetical protein